jgi:SAM-dependent methyltransferase
MEQGINYTKYGLVEKGGIWYGKKGNYWSNLSKDKNKNFVADLKENRAYDVMKKHFPQHEEVIYSCKRVGGIATLDITDNDIILDAGCMWGALSVPLARTGAKITALDQTKESLLFLKRRKEDESLDNLDIICADLKTQELPGDTYTKVIVNGVLEWVPHNSDVEVNSGNTKKVKNINYKSSPRQIQLDFLKKLIDSLKDNGTLYLAIENRYDFLYFVGLPEPHCNIRFISFMPRWIQDIMHKITKGSKFRNWTYSRRKLVELIEDAGFKNVKISYAFPDYRTPELIISDYGMKKHYRYNSPLGKSSFLKKVVIRSVEFFVYKLFRMTMFAPAFIVHAEK